MNAQLDNYTEIRDAYSNLSKVLKDDQFFNIALMNPCDLHSGFKAVNDPSIARYRYECRPQVIKCLETFKKYIDNTKDKLAKLGLTHPEFVNKFIIMFNAKLRSAITDLILTHKYYIKKKPSKIAGDCDKLLMQVCYGKSDLLGPAPTISEGETPGFEIMVSANLYIGRDHAIKRNKQLLEAGDMLFDFLAISAKKETPVTQ